MLVSQYIYTACGKDRNGAFSVFSKSKDITDEESSEIREAMMYKTPSGPGIPYEPTEPEIEELFPKKFGYFFLSSGRACLAQVCYVGRVYSDLDTRWGNYIIHAFVFNKTGDFAPYSFIEHDKFKRNLTKKEWHDDPIPDALPQLEIPETGGMPSMGELTSFFNEDRKNKLKLLIEAIVNSSNENTVHFSDDHKNLKFWFKALSLCLPKTIQNAVSFCTHFTNTLVPGNISTRIQLPVNQPDSYQFNYAQEAQKGRYAFDFARNIIPESVKPGKYAESAVKLLSSGIFEAVKLVDGINKIISAYPVNVNEASDLMNICKADYSTFENSDAVFNTILIADRAGYETQSIAEKLWAKITQFKFNAQQQLNVFAFIYKNISEISTRIEIIKSVIDNAEQLGIRTDRANAFRDDINEKAKYVLLNYLDYLKTEGLDNYIAKNHNSFFKLFLAFDVLTGLPTFKNTTEEKKAAAMIMRSTFNRLSITDLDLLMDSANSHSNGLGVELLSVIVKNAMDSGKQINNVQCAFEILTRLRSKTETAFAYLLDLINNNANQDGFIQAYINAQNNEPDFYARFENEKKADSLIREFCKKKDAYRFASNKTLTPRLFKEYFDKYYVTGADTGIFVKRLGEYLNGVQSEKRINECISILDIMKLPANADKKLFPPVYRVVLESIFSVPYEEVYKKCAKKEMIEKIDEIYNAIESAGEKLHQETRELVIITLCRQVLEKHGFQGNKQAFMFFSTGQEDANTLAANLGKLTFGESIDIFIGCYFDLVANILIAGAAAKDFDYDGVLEKVFGKIIEKGDLERITDDIVSGVKNSKADTMAFILHIFRKCFVSSPNALDRKLSNIAKYYFEKISFGDRKRVFSGLTALAEPAEAAQFERFFEEFNKEHPGGFLGLFSRKK